MTKTPLTANILFTYGDYEVAFNEDGSAYQVQNKVTGVVEIPDVQVLVQARTFAKDLELTQVDLDQPQQGTPFKPTVIN